MERVNELEAIIHATLKEYLKDLQQPNNAHLEFITVADDAQKHYQIIAMGWENYYRVFNMLFHLDILEDKIWVQEDKMEDSIAEKLLEHGATKQEIVLAYFPESHRKRTEYAVK